MPLEQIGNFWYQRFASTVPPLEAGADAARHTVAIVGAGPVGMALALGLARHGVASVLIEADDSVCEGSRATCVSRRSLEIIERLGAIDAFTAKGLPWTDGVSFYRAHQVLRFAMPHDAQQKFPPMINLQQYYFEQYLLDAIDACNGRQPGLIDLRWSASLTGLTQTNDGVTLQVETAGTHYDLHADWVVACDGGQSFVRKELGLELQGTAYTGRYVIIDIELASTYPTERRAWFDPPWWPGSTILMHKQPDNIWRIDYQLRHGDATDAALQPDAARAFVQRHLDAIGEGHLPWQMVWTSIYRAGAMSLDAYRHGRVLFAGNAAHALPIFGVRGLNSGIDDADNLAWKLGLVATGRGNEALLDSYSAERVAAFQINAGFARRSTEFMSPPSRGFDLMREAALSLAQQHPEIARLINPRQTQAITYLDSSLSTPAEGFNAGPPPGAPLVDCRLASGRHLSDKLQTPGFSLLVFDIQATADAWQEKLQLDKGLAADCGVVTIDDQTVWPHYGAQPGTVYLLRPDGHVAARWHDQPNPRQVTQALRRATHPDESTAS
jgi:3-(3-hydroxy-phenyl)propionate hydroxylase